MISRIVSPKRSAVKAITYRLIIMSLDFATLYLLTGRPRVAVGFMIASNIYTTVAYLLHERAWTRIGSGLSSSTEGNGVDRGAVSSGAG